MENGIAVCTKLALITVPSVRACADLERLFFFVASVVAILAKR